MARNIELYLNSSYCGFFELEYIENLFKEYEEKAVFLSSFIEWDEIILYAILNFEENKFISADFMLIRMPYSEYYKLCGIINNDCRLFFKRNKIFF